MNLNQLYIGNTKLNTKTNKVAGNFVTIDGESFYKISNSNKMRPFFMSMVSDSNHWMFISSNGGLTAGRKDCDTALDVERSVRGSRVAHMVCLSIAKLEQFGLHAVVPAERHEPTGERTFPRKDPSGFDGFGDDQ